MDYDFEAIALLERGLISNSAEIASGGAGARPARNYASILASASVVNGSSKRLFRNSVLYLASNFL